MLREACELKDIDDLIGRVSSIPPSAFGVFTDYATKKIKVLIDYPIISFEYKIPFEIATIEVVDPKAEKKIKYKSKLAIDKRELEKFSKKLNDFDIELKKELER